MAAFEVKVTGSEAVTRLLERITPSKRPGIWRDILGGIGGEIVYSAQKESLIGGSRFFGAPGPRGGRGKLTNAKADPHRLTNRSHVGQRSILLDASNLPRSVTVGSDRVYMAMHESGGRVTIPQHDVREHTRSSAFGKKRKPFTVPDYTVSSHTAKYPARPWLAPAIVRAGRKTNEIMLDALRKAAGL